MLYNSGMRTLCKVVGAILIGAAIIGMGLPSGETTPRDLERGFWGTYKFPYQFEPKDDAVRCICGKPIRACRDKS